MLPLSVGCRSVGVPMIVAPIVCGLVGWYSRCGVAVGVVLWCVCHRGCCCWRVAVVAAGVAVVPMLRVDVIVVVVVVVVVVWLSVVVVTVAGACC